MNYLLARKFLSSLNKSSFTNAMEKGNNCTNYFKKQRITDDIKSTYNDLFGGDSMPDSQPSNMKPIISKGPKHTTHNMSFFKPYKNQKSFALFDLFAPLNYTKHLFCIIVTKVLGVVSTPSLSCHSPVFLS